MRKEENDCVSCPAGIPCLGKSCPIRRVEHIDCDNCGDEIDPYAHAEADDEEARP